MSDLNSKKRLRKKEKKTRGEKSFEREKKKANKAPKRIATSLPTTLIFKITEAAGNTKYLFVR